MLRIDSLELHGPGGAASERCNANFGGNRPRVKRTTSDRQSYDSSVGNVKADQCAVSQPVALGRRANFSLSFRKAVPTGAPRFGVAPHSPTTSCVCARLGQCAGHAQAGTAPAPPGALKIGGHRRGVAPVPTPDGIAGRGGEHFFPHDLGGKSPRCGLSARRRRRLARSCPGTHSIRKAWKAAGSNRKCLVRDISRPTGSTCQRDAHWLRLMLHQSTVGAPCRTHLV